MFPCQLFPIASCWENIGFESLSAVLTEN